MPISKKPRSKTGFRTSAKASAPAALPDRRAMESFLAANTGHPGSDATAKAQDVIYEAWERTTSRSRIALWTEPRISRARRFAEDSPLEEAVSSELVSA